MSVVGLQNVFSGAPSTIEVLPLPPRRHVRKRAAARYGVEYDEDRDAYVVSLGWLPEEACDVAAYLAHRAVVEAPARPLVAGVRRALRQYRRDGEAVLRAIAKERRRSPVANQLAALERLHGMGLAR